MAQSVAHEREPPTWPTAALTPSYLRGPSPSALPPLTSEAAVRNLSILEARSLTGPQIDAINRESWHAALGSRWLMREQECEYKPKEHSCKYGMQEDLSMQTHDRKDQMF